MEPLFGKKPTHNKQNIMYYRARNTQRANTSTTKVHKTNRFVRIFISYVRRHKNSQNLLTKSVKLLINSYDNYLLSPRTTLLTPGLVRTSVVRLSIFARCSYKRPKGHHNSLMNHCGMLTVTVGIIVLLLSSLVLSCNNLVKMIRMYAVPTISEALLAAFPRRS